jgi:CubicO group peptidase (beta-lactamase class C family)
MGIQPKGGQLMKKSFAALLLAFCLLSGCAAVSTAGQPEQPASVLPLMQPSPVRPEPASDALAVSQEISDPPPSPSSTPSLQEAALSEQLDRLFASLPEFSGSVLIQKTGKIILYKSYGLASAEGGVKNTPDTKFLIGSVTKQFTAVAVMQLYEKGLLDIKGKLSDYIPDFKRGSEITLKNLLTQTSGIADYLNGDPALVSQIPCAELSARKLVDLVGDMPLKFEPGTKYAYSNTNYLLLGYIVEQISGLAYGDYLEKNILEPLGMTNTGVFDINHPPPDMATGYMQPGEPVCYFTSDAGSYTDRANFVMGSYGAGCLYSAVGDLCLWDRALSTEKLVSRSSVNLMFNPTVPVPGADPECAYGFGWVIENDPLVGTVVRHTGILSGFRAYNGWFADMGVIVIVLSNIKEFTGRDTLIPSLKQLFTS